MPDDDVTTALDALMTAIHEKCIADLQAQGPEAVQRFTDQAAERRRQMTDLVIAHAETEANLKDILRAIDDLVATAEHHPPLARPVLPPDHAKGLMRDLLALEQQRQAQERRVLTAIHAHVVAWGDDTILQRFTAYVEALRREQEPPPP
jgi:hypothetical protein